MTKLCALCCIFASFAVLPLGAGVSFGNADLNDKDEILFTVRRDFPGTPSYRSLFYAKLVNGAPAESPRALTCYPERMELLSGGSVLQIRNRCGTARYSFETGTLEWTEQADTIPLDSMPLFPRAVSPDGAWSCFVVKTGFAEGILTFENSATGRRTALDPHASVSYDSLPVKWAPDSSLVLYAKDGKVCFCSPDALFRGVEIDEAYREIGPGSIDSVCWAGGSVFYIDGDMLYKINVKELYTTGLYSAVIGRGTPVGRLPEPFDPSRDVFSVDKNGTSLFLIKSGKLFSRYLLRGNSADYLPAVFSRPYVSDSGSLIDAAILWDSKGTPYVWMRIMPYSGSKAMAAVYRASDSLSPLLSAENSCRPVISPDGNRAAFFSGSTVYVYDVSSWKRIGELAGENTVSAVWNGNDTLYVGGERSVRRWNLASGTSSALFLSSASSWSWDRETRRATVTTGGKTFSLDASLKKWTELPSPRENTVSMQNGRYRVFLGTTPSPHYENALYVRTLSGKAVTRAVFPESAQKTPARKKAALAFDAYDSADGLPLILSALDTHNIRGTFFFNGEFIRRYPKETKQISLTGNTCASLFFSELDFMRSPFVIDEDFIRRGLARNEDEFFRCTGKELSLLWHAPFYRATDAARKAGKKAGYAYAESVIGAAEKRTNTEGYSNARVRKLFASAEYRNAADFIESCLASLSENGGGIVPVSVGSSRDPTNERVYRKLDLLISAILDAGFDIVGADELAE
ncbi:polysaccharide deacetylase family protein [Treponema socranskii]|uniref:polysaccharide deacetylase family protein n=1 Tax=Treponema socranskii TaxID=53419 RepID=UPI0028EA1AE4|nr:polysaccharide deacetylase family protein [Treponema socranskii]